MKLDLSKDFKDLDSMFGDYDDLFFDEPKKKKKGGKKDKKDKKSRDTMNDEAYKESLKTLTKSELRRKAEAMGVDLRDIDTSSKKAMRKAIMQARDETLAAKKAIKAVDTKKGPAGLQVPGHQFDPKLHAGLTRKAQVQRPPYYFDEDSHDFVICDADSATDITVFNAMRSLGGIRKTIRPDDGFAEMMDRIHKQLISSDDCTEPQQVIETTWVDVSDNTSPVSPPAGLNDQLLDSVVKFDTASRDFEEKGKPNDVEVIIPTGDGEAIALTAGETAKLSEDLDKALETIQTTGEIINEISKKAVTKRKRAAKKE